MTDSSKSASSAPAPGACRSWSGCAPTRAKRLLGRHAHRACRRPGTARARAGVATGQSRHLLMNTVASQVTVFTDASVEHRGPDGGGAQPVRVGPDLRQSGPARRPDGSGRRRPTTTETLAEARDLGPGRLSRPGPSTATIWTGSSGGWSRTAPAQVTRARPPRPGGRAWTRRRRRHAGRQSVTLDDGTRADRPGRGRPGPGPRPGPARPTTETRAGRVRRAARADVHAARPTPPTWTCPRSRPGEPVLLRGLGLNFFDYLALFTLGRGGIFDRASGRRLVYRPSGHEPRLYAGSRRGVPVPRARREREGRPRPLPPAGC